MNKKKLFVDFDNTIVNSIKKIVDIYNDDYRYYPEFKPIQWTEINTYEFSECRCASQKMITEYFKQPRFYRSLVYMDYAKEILTKLQEDYQIIVVSMGTPENLVGKEIWLKENLPFVEFIGLDFNDYDDKSSVDMRGGYHIDDNTTMLKSSNADLKILFGDRYSWNEDWNGIHCYNWYEVKGMLELLGDEIPVSK